MKNKLILLLILVIVITIGAILLLKTTAKNSTVKNATNNQTATPTKTVKKYTSSYINVTASGFEPNLIKVKSNTRIVWINKSGKTVTVNSDPHPTHTAWPFLNLGAFDNKSSVSVIVTKPGRYTYHNHYNPTQKGILIVE